MTIFAKSSILDVSQDSLFTSAAGNNLRKKLNLRCGQVLNMSLQPLIICKKIHLRCLTGSECVSAIYTAITIRRLPIRSVSYLFTKFHHASNNVVHGESHVILYSTYRIFSNRSCGFYLFFVFFSAVSIWGPLLFEGGFYLPQFSAGNSSDGTV